MHRCEFDGLVYIQSNFDRQLASPALVPSGWPSKTYLLLLLAHTVQNLSLKLSDSVVESAWGSTAMTDVSGDSSGGGGGGGGGTGAALPRSRGSADMA